MSFLGKAIGAITGFFGSKPSSSSSSSSNKAFDQLNKTYTPQTQTGVASNNFMAGLLGVPGGDTAGSDAGFANYLAKAGYAPALERMQRGVVGGQAARGLLRSGSTQRRLLEEGAKIDQGFFNNYFQNLNALNNAGLNAGQIISGAGGVSSSSSQGERNQSDAAIIGNVISGTKKLIGGGGIASIFT